MRNARLHVALQRRFVASDISSESIEYYIQNHTISDFSLLL
jgi:hypothetical protein